MTTLIKGGTIVAADRSYVADVLIEGETIQAIGTGLTGDKMIDGSGCYVMPGGIDPHTPSRHAVHGHQFGRQLRQRHRAPRSPAARRWWSISVIPGRGQPLMEAIADWDKRAELATTDYAYHMCITYWSDKVQRRHGEGGRARRHHLQAFHGLQGRADGQRRGDVRLVLALRRTRRDAARARRERRHRAGAAEALSSPRASPAPRATRFRVRPMSRARRPTARSCSPIRRACRSISCTPPASRRTRRSGARAQKGMRVYGEPLIQHLVLDESEYYNKDWKHAARRVMSPPFRDKKNQDDLWNGLRAGSLQVVATDHCAFTTKQKEFGLDGLHQDPERHRRPRGSHAGALDLRRRHGPADARTNSSR